MKEHKGKSRKKFSGKNNPLYNEEMPLSFDNFTEDETLELSERQLADRFVAQWHAQIDPFERYKTRLLGEVEDASITVSQIKNLYRRYVLREAWSEAKYAMVIDSVLRAREAVSSFSIEKHGKLYESGRLEVQLAAKRSDQRRKRI